MMNVKDKVSFITGALGGIGRSYTKALLRNGVKGVSLIDICDHESAEKFQNELSQEFGPNKTIFIKTDLKQRQNIQDAFEKTIDHFKQLDIVINNAGIMNEDSPEETITVNLVAPLIITELALKIYLPKYQTETGVIINTGSVAGLVVFEKYPLYSISKVGLVSVSSAYGNEATYQKYKVKVITICPGGTITPLLSRILNKSELELDQLKMYQSARVIGDCLLKAIESDKNGSVWIADSSKIQEFNYAQLETISKNVINKMSNSLYESMI